MKIRTRYAPSPTGRMHVGIYEPACMLNLIAKHEGGDFLLRIEDTDQEEKWKALWILSVERWKLQDFSGTRGRIIPETVDLTCSRERVKTGVLYGLCQEAGG